MLVVVYTDDGKTLLLKRSKPFEFWQSITGSLEVDESPGDAARRELCEEAGFTNEGELIDTGRSRIFKIDPRWRSRYAADVTENTEYEWRFRLPTPLDVQLDHVEHTASRWVPIEAAPLHVWSWTNKEALKSLATILRSNT